MDEFVGKECTITENNGKAGFELDNKGMFFPCFVLEKVDKGPEKKVDQPFVKSDTEYQYYQPLQIHSREVQGWWWALEAMRLPKESEGDSEESIDSDIPIIGPQDRKLAAGLVKTGDDHAKFARGIITWLKISCQVGFLIQFETYKIGVQTLSTTSSMHGELRGLSGAALADQKQRDLSTKVYTRILHASYQALRSMYKARRSHRHEDWQVLCDWIETLPYFDVLIYPESTKTGNQYHSATVEYQDDSLEVQFDFDSGEEGPEDDEYFIAYMNGVDSGLFSEETIEGVTDILRERQFPKIERKQEARNEQR